MSLLNQQIRVSKEGNYDELYTPKNFVTPILKYIPQGVKTIWCPCDGVESEYFKVLVNAGYNVKVTHIGNGSDFLTTKVDCDMIITNPPFSIKDKILARCYELEKPFALLLSEKALGGQRRNKMYREKGLGVVVLDKRADFTGKGACWFNVHYYIHTKEMDGKICFEEVKDEQI